MIRRGVKVQLVVFAVMTALGLTYVGANYVGLFDRVTHAGYTVTADFPQSGGVFPNAEVTYRGVTVGRVGQLALSRSGVKVPLKLHDGVHVPSDVRAVVANRSAIGEPYVDLRPRHASGPYLSAGDHIARADTRTPLSTNTLLLNLDHLVNSVDKKSLATVVGELGTAFRGTGSDLSRLVDAGNKLTASATANLPQTVRLLDDGKVVLDTQRDSAGDIESFSHDLAALTHTLRTSDPDLRAVLDNGVRSSSEVTDLLRTSSPALSVLVANLLTVQELQAARLPALRQILVTYPAVVAGGYTVVPGDGTAHFGLALNANNPPACTKGYGSTQRRTPSETGDRRANTAVHCAEPRGSATSVRGAQNAPHGPDTPTYEPGGSSGTAAGQNSDSAPRTDATSADGGSPAATESVGVPTHGEDSWKWLLTGPLGD